MNALLDGGLERWLGPADGDAPDWWVARRRRALVSLEGRPLPHAKDEAWRYTSLKTLLEQGFAAVPTPADLPEAAIDACLIPGLDSHRLILVDGCLNPALSSPTPLPAGIQIYSLRGWLAKDPDALRAWPRAVGDGDEAFFTLLNEAALTDGLAIRLGPGIVLDQPIEIIHISSGDPELRVVQPRILVHLEAGAQAALIERYIGLGDGPSCTNAVIEVSLARDALLRHERIQTEAPAAFHLSGLYLVQAEVSRYQGINIGLGGRWARTELNARLQGRGAECLLWGLYLAGTGQLLDYHLDIAHQAPACRSLEHFKGILDGQGRAVFDGRVLVARAAQQSDAAMTNRNLMLSEQAEVDAKPQLEINADDVQCSHGTTVGQIEPELLFYLRARGIEAQLARRMLCLGFAGEIIDQFADESLRGSLTAAIDRRLG
ncbi:Fe-S cluster assembly protein SufD [Caldichromatium japonicum]|uniref:Fe-S cluster assembly protein SufD n=1 Tax=Caldichromatium japonicum TaxID=2699430 RepID=A0A6G7VC99_9GAMM|nr:Fe-S cluster assembly protein SufD [Caldichromatium japonicum]QIK37478.1 Fe-S cluster assembly protein SufD [Caldichromatium japonicum]